MRLSLLSSIFLVASMVAAIPVERLSQRSTTSLDAREENNLLDLYGRDEFAFGESALEARDEDDLFDLYLRDEFGLDTIDARSFPDEVALEARAAGKKQANAAARKERKTAAKAEVKKAERKTPGGGAAKKAELKAASTQKHNEMKAAGQRHRNTQGLPDRNAKFSIPAGGGKPQKDFTGKDVRQANFVSHIHHNGKPFGKTFNNNPHADTTGHPGTNKPLDGMTGPGHEHPLTSATTKSQKNRAHTNSPARIITQHDAATGKFTHKGVIAHDQSRTSGPGLNDHFQVHPKP